MQWLKTPFLSLSICIALSVVMIPDARSWVPDGVAISPAATNYKPCILSDGAGGSIVAWYGGSGSDIFGQRLMADGSTASGWPSAAPLTVCDAVGLQEHPSMVSDLAGGALIFWQDARNGSNYDIFAQHIGSAGEVFGSGSSNWVADGISIAGAAGNQYTPVAVSDGAGGAIVVWQDGRLGAGNYDVYAQRVDGDGNRLWAPAGVPVCVAANNQINPTIVADGAGGAFIAWQDYRKGNEYDIYLQHLNANGVLVPGGRWAADGLGICGATNSQFYPALATDAFGGVYVAWQDFRTGTDNHIFAQRVSGDGVVPTNWPANGTPICQAPFSQYSPVVVGDASGGAFIAWQDYRTGVTNHVFAQHVTADNVTLTSNGVAVCLASNGQFSPQIAYDGQDGAFVTWYDSRSGSTNDIYVQRIDDQGLAYPGWDTNGLPVCRATNTQQFPVIATSSPGSAIMTWQDLRSGGATTAAIFAAQAITAPVAAADENDGIEGALGPPRPNPSRGMAQVQLTLPHSAFVRAEVIDLSGRRLTTIAAETFSAGTHALTWDGSVAGGGRASPGVYLVRAQWGGFERTQRIVRLQ
jgi:hypothetical protein